MPITSQYVASISDADGENLPLLLTTRAESSLGAGERPFAIAAGYADDDHQIAAATVAATGSREHI